jgi:hypothetical protein
MTPTYTNSGKNTHPVYHHGLHPVQHPARAAAWPRRRRVGQAAVWAALVVMLDVASQNANKLLAADDQQLTQALPTDRSDPPFGDGVGVGRLNRCEDDLGAGRAPHVVKHPGELGVPVADQELERGGLVAEDGDEGAGLLGDPPPSRVSGDAGQVHPPTAELDDEQHLHPLQEGRVDGEEVAGHDPGGLLAQKRPPARGSTSGRQVKAVGAQNPADGEDQTDPGALRWHITLAAVSGAGSQRSITKASTSTRGRPAVPATRTATACVPGDVQERTKTTRAGWTDVA